MPGMYKPWLSAQLVFFLHLIWKRTFVRYVLASLWAKCPLCHLTNTLKALNKSQSTEYSQKKVPLFSSILYAPPMSDRLAADTSTFLLLWWWKIVVSSWHIIKNFHYITVIVRKIIVFGCRWWQSSHITIVIAYRLRLCVCWFHFKGLKVEVVPSDFGESLQKSSFDCPAEYVKETALQKALCVAQRLKNETVSTVSIF